MLAERRTRALRDLNASLGEARATRQVFHNAMSVLEAHAFDLPFTLLYELHAQEGCYRLAGSVGVALDDPIAPAILFEDSATPWPADLSSARADHGRPAPRWRRARSVRRTRAYGPSIRHHRARHPARASLDDGGDQFACRWTRPIAAAVDLQFSPEGLRCVIRLPLSAKVGLVDAAER